MKRFDLRLLILAAFIFVVDLCVGGIGAYLVKNSKGGDSYRTAFIARACTADVLVLGSSRAIHHYDSEIMEDSLHCSVYNCGLNGNGIICNYGFFKMATSRYTPKMVVYDIMAGYDLEKGDNSKYLGRLRNFYDDDDVKQIFYDVDKKEAVKMLSSMYRYNSVLPQLAVESVKPLHSDIKGYRPEDVVMDYIPEIKEENERTYHYDPLKLAYFEKLVSDCKQKDIKLVFTVSPLYKNEIDGVMTPIVELAKKHNVPFISHYTDKQFNDNPKYFHDRVHLCRKGATEYTKTIAHELKTYF